MVQPASEIDNDPAAGFPFGEGYFEVLSEVKMREYPPWLAPTYFLDESDPDLLILRRTDGSFVAAFSVRGATTEGILQAAQEDYRQRLRLEPQEEEQQKRPPSPAPQEGAGSLAGKDEERWEEFLEGERRALESRRGGQLRRDLGDVLPGESPEYIHQLGREDQRRAEEGLVEIMKEGEPLYKHIEELTPDDRPGRIRAEMAKSLWLRARLEQKGDVPC